ncbi:putative HNHc nuclease [Pediococcus pentosaceus]|uniref:putative HNHc nuclease n=1 Tax=Pediococcus pentosaceus TaxID=1255 RepID=UPI003982C1DB
MVTNFDGRLVKLQGNELTIKVSDQLLLDTLNSVDLTKYPQMEIGIVDKRHLSSKQRRHAYALMHDMASWTGYDLEDFKNLMKGLFYESFGSMPFSLANTDMTTARMFISFLIEVALDNHIPMRASALERTDDLEVYMYQSMRHRSCALCGKPHSDIHHIDAIGMGNNRKTIDHRDRRMICLCREHHQEAHRIGWATFSNLYHVVGVVPTEQMIIDLGLMSKKRLDEFKS